jgi:hypothetical protein
MKFQNSFLTLSALAGLQAFAAPSVQDRQLREVNEVVERSLISIFATEILDLIESTVECAGCDVC